ncbi:MAG: TetR/AcrR family transcriptional regulator [Pseudomonadota bacterium]
MVKLSREDWLSLGLATLEVEGFTALKADKLTRKAGVTRGSFYGYFADVAAFHAAVLEAWSDGSRKIAAKLASLPAEERLKGLISASAETSGALERAVRAWAQSDPMAARAVAALDAFRIETLIATFEDLGLAPSDARTRAKLLYAAAMGAMIVPKDTIKLSADDLAAFAELISRG